MMCDKRASSTTRRVLIRFGLAWVFLPLFFLLTGGSLRWWAAWVYCAVLLLPMTVFVLRMLRKDPEFLEWRIKMREKERTQRRVVSWGTPVFAALLLLPGLDERFRWSAVPAAAVIAADVLVLAGYLGVLWVFSVNRWAGRTVETRPGQEVITTGPYSIVRHPMYTSALLLSLAMPIALGSWWALIPAFLCVPVSREGSLPACTGGVVAEDNRIPARSTPQLKHESRPGGRLSMLAPRSVRFADHPIRALESMTASLPLAALSAWVSRWFRHPR